MGEVGCLWKDGRRRKKETPIVDNYSMDGIWRKLDEFELTITVRDLFSGDIW